MTRNGSNGFRLDWQNIIMTVGLVLTMVGGFWYLAYVPIEQRLSSHERSISELRDLAMKHFADDEGKYLTQKEHNEFKQNMRDSDMRSAEELKRLGALIEKRRLDAMTKADAQQLLNTTRVEFLSEIKRLDQESKDAMKRREFEGWKSERDKVIAIIQDRQNRFSEALDSMYSKLMQQMPSYAPR